MSKQLLTLAFIAAVLALSLSQVFAQGARVVLMLRHQQKISGRLLAVRDSALVISTNETQERKFDARAPGLLVVKNQNIRRVIVKGESKVLKGVAKGFVIGAGIGTLIGFAASDRQESDSWQVVTAEAQAATLGIWGGVAGSIVGVLASAASNKDKAIYPAINHDFSALKPFAQFPEQEPEELSAIK